MHVAKLGNHFPTMLTAADGVRYRALLGWLKTNGVETVDLPTTYRELRDEALARGLIRFIDTPRTLSEPFAIGTQFYGESLDEAIDAVSAENGLSATGRRVEPRHTAIHHVHEPSYHPGS